MKNLKLITVAIFIAFAFNATSTYAFPAISATANSDKELYTAIQQLVTFPEKGIDRGASGYVWTTFHVDEGGWIEVKDVQGKKIFADYVKQQLNLISVENPDLFGKTYRIKINFDFQER